MKLTLVIVLAFVLLIVGIVLLGDTLWCAENYALDRVPHCMYYENSILGRYIQP